MTTDVSTIPLACRASGTRGRVLIDERVDVGPELRQLYGRRTGKESDGGFRGDELALQAEDGANDLKVDRAAFTRAGRSGRTA
jgi:hypothetical protein